MLLRTTSKLRRIGFFILVGAFRPSTPRPRPIETKYQYAAKAACSLLSTFGDLALAQGTYRTLINIGNPTNETVKFAVKPNVSGSLGAPSGRHRGSGSQKGRIGTACRVVD